jgi:hypothetical protein
MGRPALERGGISPEGATSPRARRSFVRAMPPPRTKQSFARGGLGLTVLAGRWGRQVHGPLPLGRDCVCHVL